MITPIFDKFEKCRKTGPGSFLARCPAHKDGSPSLSLREMPDGRVLMHCFAGCGVDDILGAIGVGMEELFPPKPIGHAPAVRRPFPAGDVLEALARESLVVLIIAADMQAGKPFNRARLAQAVERIERGRALANG